MGKARNATLFLFALLFLFLPWFEHEVKGTGYYLLLFVGGLIGLSLDWKSVRLDLLEMLFLLFLITGAISTVFSEGISRSFMELLRYLAYFLVFITVRRVESEDNKKLKNIFLGCLLINSLLLSVVSWSFLFNIPLLSYPSSGMNLYYGVFGHNRLADLLLFAIPVTIFIILELKINSKGSVRRDKLFIGLLVFFVITFISTFSKSGYMVLIGVLFLTGMYLEKKIGDFRRIKKILGITVFIVFAFYSLVIINTYFVKSCGTRSYSQLCKPLYGDWRWDYYKVAINSLMVKPITGAGLDNFRYLSKIGQSKPASWSLYGENYYFTLASETGILGWGFMMTLLTVAFYRLFKKSLTGFKFQEVGILFAITGSAVHGLVTVDWYLLSLYLYFWVSLGLLIPVNKNNAYPKKALMNIGLLFISLIIIFVPILHLTGLILIRLSEKNNVISLLPAASIITAYDANTQKKIGRMFQESGDIDRALFYYQLSQKLDKNDFSTYVLAGDIYTGKGDYKNAVQNYFKAASLDPLDLNQYRERAEKQQRLIN